MNLVPHILRTTYHALINTFVIVPNNSGLSIILDGEEYQITVTKVSK